VYRAEFGAHQACQRLQIEKLGVIGQRPSLITLQWPQ